MGPEKKKRKKRKKKQFPKGIALLCVYIYIELMGVINQLVIGEHHPVGMENNVSVEIEMLFALKR